MVESKPLVSIGIPVYNGEPYLRQALDSLLAQDYGNFEIIISDNASTDKTQEICLEYTAIHQKVRYNRNTKNLGAAQNFNKVFNQSSSPYFMWAAYDDLWDKTYVSKCVELLNQSPSAVLCCSEVTFIDDDNNVNFEWGEKNKNREILGREVEARVPQLISRYHWYEIYGLIRADSLKLTNGLTSKYGSDVILLLELLLIGEFVKVPEPLFYYRKIKPKSVEIEMKGIDPNVTNPPLNNPGSELARELLKVVVDSNLDATVKQKIEDKFIEVLCFQNIFWRDALISENRSLFGSSVSSSELKYIVKTIISTNIKNQPLATIVPISEAKSGYTLAQEKPVKVLYDISVLGQGHLHLRARTGIFRVVENIAEGLAKSEECDLMFGVSQYFQLLDASLDYLESNSKLKSIPLLHSSFTRVFYRKLFDLYSMIGIQQQVNHSSNSGTDPKLLEQLKKELENSLKIIGGSYSHINYDNLEEAEIFHSPYDQIPASVKQSNKTQNFLTIYDLIPILFPEFLLNEQIPLFFKNTLNSISQNDWVICISNSTKNDLCNYLNLDSSRVFVTHLAAEPTIFYPCDNAEKIALTRSKYKIPDVPYLLSLSTLEPRKNIDQVIRSFAKLIQSENITDLYLVLVGTPGWKYDKILEEISKQNFLKDRIIFTGYVPEEDLAALYSGALVFIYPSFYEGFGLPPLEAMQCGVPVITSNTSSLPEVVGDAGIMVEPQDTDGLCHSILEIYKRPSIRETMAVKSLAQAKKFSWERCTQETIAAYRTALS